MSSVEEDEAKLYTSKALYVEPLSYPINLNGMPATGHEYIHMQRMQDASENLTRHASTEEKGLPEKECSQQNNLDEWKRIVAKHFRYITKELILKKQELKRKFPNKILPPLRNEVSSCYFCLGSELCNKVYSSAIHDENFQESHLPLLSIVLHLDQNDIAVLLDYLYKWYQKVGLNQILSKWIYALLACLQKPVSDNCESILLKLYEDFSIKYKKRNETEKSQFLLLLSILENYFSVHTYNIGPSLARFHL